MISPYLQVKETNNKSIAHLNFDLIGDLRFFLPFGADIRDVCVQIALTTDGTPKTFVMAAETVLIHHDPDAIQTEAMTALQYTPLKRVMSTKIQNTSQLTL